MRALKMSALGALMVWAPAHADVVTTPLVTPAPICRPSPGDEVTDLKIKPSLGAAHEELQASHFLRAISLLRPLAEDGNVEAQRLLGDVLMRPGCNFPTDKTEAANWLRKAAEKHDVQAEFLYGQAVLHGTGVAADDKAAFDWIKRAAKAGDMRSQTSLGVLYYTGRGVKADVREAINWTVSAAEQGAPAALSNIAKSYLNGNGVRKDLRRAMFFIAAAQQRIPPVQYQFMQRLQQTRYTIVRQLSVEDVKKIEQDAEKWSPGKGSLADVLADADKWSPDEAVQTGASEMADQ